MTRKASRTQMILWQETQASGGKPATGTRFRAESGWGPRAL